MAIELCSSDDSSTSGNIISPRISFSHDVSQPDSVAHVEQNNRSISSSSSIDFDFCAFRESFNLESSSADELFFNGKILPIEIKKTTITPTPPKKTEHHPLTQPPPPPPQQDISKPSILDNEKSFKIKKGILEPSSDEKQSSKSFWRFKRSSSLNCGTSYASTLCPLPRFSRSSSAGSSSSSSTVKHSLLSKNLQKSSLSVSSSTCQQQHQKPPLKKVPYKPYNNGVRVSTVINVHPASLFGFSSIFSGGKDKNNKKK